MKITLLMGVILFMAVMGTYGYMKGIINMMLSVVTLVATIAVTSVLTIPVSALVEKSDIGKEIHKSVYEIVKEANVADAESIKNLDYPDVILNPISDGAKDATVAMEDYVADSLSKVVIKSGVYLILSILIFSAIRLAVTVLNIASRLPVINDINKLAGAIVGFAMGMALLWIACLIVAAFSNEAWAQDIFVQINESEVLSFIYNNNLVLWLVSGKL